MDTLVGVAQDVDILSKKTLQIGTNSTVLVPRSYILTLTLFN